MIRKLAWIENTRQEALEAITPEQSQDLYMSLQAALASELDNGGAEEVITKIEAAMDDVEASWVAACKTAVTDDTIDMDPQPEDIMTPNEAQLKSAQARLSNTQDRLDSGYYESKGLTAIATEAAEKLAAEVVELEEACKNEDECVTIIEPTPEQNMETQPTQTRNAEEALESLRIGDLTLNELLATGLISLDVFRYTIAQAEGEEVAKPQPPAAQPKAQVQANGQGAINLAVAYFLGGFMKAGQQYKVKSRKGDGMYTQLVAENPGLAITDVQFRKAINLLLNESALANNVAELKAAGGNWAPKSRWFLPSTEG